MSALNPQIRRVECATSFPNPPSGMVECATCAPRNVLRSSLVGTFGGFVIQISHYGYTSTLHSGRIKIRKISVSYLNGF